MRCCGTGFGGSRGEFKNGVNLLAGDSEFLHEFVNAHILDVFKDGGYRCPSTFEYPCAAALAWDALHGGALGPIERCHVRVLVFIVASFPRRALHQSSCEPDAPDEKKLLQQLEQMGATTAPEASRPDLTFHRTIWNLTGNEFLKDADQLKGIIVRLFGGRDAAKRTDAADSRLAQAIDELYSRRLPASDARRVMYEHISLRWGPADLFAARALGVGQDVRPRESQNLPSPHKC